MSFFTTANSQLALALWPATLPITSLVSANDPTGYEAIRGSWQELPSGLEDLASRVRVVSKSVITDRTRPFDVLNVLQDNQGQEVTRLLQVRLQGMLAGFRLNADGNWNQDSKSKAGARQSVDLTDCGNSLGWRVQCQGISDVKFIILRAIAGSKEDQVVRDTSQRAKLYIARPVFVNRSPAPATTGPFRASRFNPLRRPRPRFELDRAAPLGMGKRTDSGSLVRATPITFNKGDFVDVLVSFEVVRLDEKDIVHLHLDTIIQLKPANEMRTLFPNHTLFTGAAAPASTHAPTAFAYNFGQDTADSEMLEEGSSASAST